MSRLADTALREALRAAQDVQAAGARYRAGGDWEAACAAASAAYERQVFWGRVYARAVAREVRRRLAGGAA